MGPGEKLGPIAMVGSLRWLEPLQGMDPLQSIKGAARVDACRHGLHGLHAMRVDMHAEACVSTVSGFGWPACWSSVASLGSMRVMRVDPVLTFPSKARFGV